VTPSRHHHCTHAHHHGMLMRRMRKGGCPDDFIQCKACSSFNASFRHPLSSSVGNNLTFEQLITLLLGLPPQEKTPTSLLPNSIFPRVFLPVFCGLQGSFFGVPNQQENGHLHSLCSACIICASFLMTYQIMCNDDHTVHSVGACSFMLCPRP